MKRKIRPVPVAITGIGVVSAIGSNPTEFWESCLQGRTRVEEIPEHWKNYYNPKSHYWSPLALPNFSDYGLRRSDLLALDTTVLNAIVAADDALSLALIDKHVIEEKSGRYLADIGDPFRAGIFVGTGLGCVTSTLQNYVPHLLGGLRNRIDNDNDSWGQDSLSRELKENLSTQPRVSPVASCKSMANSISAALSIRYGFQAANDTLIAACAAGSTAIARAFCAIQRGELDIAIAGGSEYYGDRAAGVFMAFDRLNTLVKPELEIGQANRPFDRRRSGFLFSEGAACMLVLEAGERAAHRGIRPFANIIGTAATSDARSLVSISRDANAIPEMVKRALTDAGIHPSQIDYINTHGTATEQNDAIEAEIISRIFREDVALNSTKSLLGHTIGACGALEAAVTALTIYSQEIHPSLNIEDPVRELNFVRERTSMKIEYAMTQNFGFGGHNVGLVLTI